MSDVMCSMRLAVEHQLMSQHGLSSTMAWLQVKSSLQSRQST